MSKKTIKFILALVGATFSIAAIIYFIYNKKNKNTISEEVAEPEDKLDAADALDLSSLKFSQHYVDLR